jgi:hypothetical protein
VKKILILIFILMFVSVVSEKNSFAQQKKFKFSKVSRDTKKMARKYQKDGFLVFPGRPSIAQQLNDAFTKQADMDDQGFPKYIIANGSSIANGQAAAQMQAIELAKQNLVSLIETNMRSVIENEVGNNQLAANDAASITKTMQVSVNKVAKKLSRVMELFSIFRVLPNKNIEVQVMLGYSYELAQQAILDEMRLQMKQESEDMQVKYDDFLNPEKYKQGNIKNIKDGQE